MEFHLIKLILMLVVLPLGTALILGISIYYVHVQALSGPYLPDWAIWSFLIGGAIPGTIISLYFGKKYKDIEYIFGDKQSAVDDLIHITTIVYIQIVIIIGITVFSFINPINLKFEYSQLMSAPYRSAIGIMLYVMVFSIISIGRMYLRKDFQFYIAQMSMNVAVATETDQDKRMHFLKIALDSYNEFIKRNLRLEFDTAKLLSRVLISNDKITVLNKIDKSFDDQSSSYEDPKFKPVNCLSEIGQVQPSEQFLVKKSPWTNVKEMGTFLAVVIPVLIAVLQLILPNF